MKAAKYFVEYNKEQLSLPDNADPPEKSRQRKIRRLTKVFWDTAGAVFRSDVRKRPKIADEVHEAFLASVQMVLDADIRAHNKDSLGNWSHGSIVPYVLRHRSHLPVNFVATLKKANEENVLDISNILSDGKTDGIQRIETYWHALENPSDPIEPDPKPDNESDWDQTRKPLFV
jgi:hypothetical protein